MPVHFDGFRDVDGKVSDPKTFEEAVEFLFQSMDDDEKSYVRENGSAMLHFGLGMAMRNNWDLWSEDCPLANDTIMRFGGGYGDDVSGRILGELAKRVGFVPGSVRGRPKLW